MTTTLPVMVMVVGGLKPQNRPAEQRKYKVSASLFLQQTENNISNNYYTDLYRKYLEMGIIEV